MDFFFNVDLFLLAYFVVHVKSVATTEESRQADSIGTKKTEMSTCLVCIVDKYKYVSGQVSGTFMVVINQNFLS